MKTSVVCSVALVVQSIRLLMISPILLLLLVACTGQEGHMRERLQYVSACNRADTVFTQRWLPTVDSLVSYYTHHGSANDRMMAHYVAGRVHHDMGEAPQALDCYQRAAEQADTTRADCDLYTLTAVYGQMADLYHAQYLPDDELQALKTAERIAWKDKDTLVAIKAYELRIRPYHLKGEKDSMLFIMKDAREQYLHLGDTADAATAIYACISIYLDQHNLSEAKHWLEIYEKGSGNFAKDGTLIKGETFYYDKGRYLLATGRTTDARESFEHILDSSLLEARYRGLLSVYKRMGIADSIAKYAELFAAANDSGFIHVNQEKVHQISAMYDYSHQQQLAEKKCFETVRWKARTILFLLFFFLTMLLSFYVFSRFKIRKLEEIHCLVRTKETLEQLLSKEEMLTKEKQEEILRLNSMNSRMHRTMNEESQRLQLQINALREQLLKKDEAISDPVSNGIIADFKKKFQSYTTHYKLPEEKNWKELEKAFSVLHPSYYDLITSHRSMTKDQIRLCLLIGMGFAEREMATTLEVDGKKIDRKKRQINKKLFRDDSSSTLKDNLKPYIRTSLS